MHARLRGNAVGGPGGDFREVDVGPGHVVDVVGQHVEGDGHHDLDDGAFVEVGVAQCGQVGVRHTATASAHAAGET